MLTSEPKCLASIGYQFCLPMVLRWCTARTDSAKNNILLNLTPVLLLLFMVTTRIHILFEGFADIISADSLGVI